jgi:uncharacterized protein YjcR
MSTWPEIKANAKKLYFAGDTVETIASALGIEKRKVIGWADMHGWAEERALSRADAAAKALADEAAADAKFRQLSEAIVALAAAQASKAKSGGLKAKDVLDLAKATELAQRGRERAKRGR